VSATIDVSSGTSRERPAPIIGGLAREDNAVPDFQVGVSGRGLAAARILIRSEARFEAVVPIYICHPLFDICLGGCPLFE